MSSVGRCGSSSALAALAIAVGSLQAASAATIHSEAVNGDLSGNRLAPTALVLSVGTNTIIGTTISGDLDYFQVALPVGSSFTGIILSSFASVDDVAFMAIQSGTTFTTSASNPNVAVLLGYTHFGTGGLAGTALVGTNIIDELGQGPGSIGFTPPLANPNYTFWVQQTQSNLVSYTFDLVVVPEPSTAVLLALGLGALGFARRRG
jgi:hypothetical protein